MSSTIKFSLPYFTLDVERRFAFLIYPAVSVSLPSAVQPLNYLVENPSCQVSHLRGLKNDFECLPLASIVLWRQFSVTG